MRQKALMPVRMDAQMPPVYRMWRMCQKHNKLWWPGGISNQPHILMAEFDVCDLATKEFAKQARNYTTLLQDKPNDIPKTAILRLPK